MSALTQKLRNAAVPGSWCDPKTFIEAAERIEELEGKLLQLTEQRLSEALSEPPTAKRSAGRPRKTTQQ